MPKINGLWWNDYVGSVNALLDFPDRFDYVSHDRSLGSAWSLVFHRTEVLSRCWRQWCFRWMYWALQRGDTRQDPGNCTYHYGRYSCPAGHHVHFLLQVAQNRQLLHLQRDYYLTCSPPDSKQQKLPRKFLHLHHEELRHCLRVILRSNSKHLHANVSSDRVNILWDPCGILEAVSYVWGCGLHPHCDLLLRRPFFHLHWTILFIAIAEIVEIHQHRARQTTQWYARRSIDIGKPEGFNWRAEDHVLQ